MNQFIQDRGEILALLGSMLTRFPALRAGQILVGAAMDAGHDVDIFNLTDAKLKDALAAYDRKLHEGVMKHGSKAYGRRTEVATEEGPVP